MGMMHSILCNSRTFWTDLQQQLLKVSVLYLVILSVPKHDEIPYTINVFFNAIWSATGRDFSHKNG